MVWKGQWQGGGGGTTETGVWCMCIQGHSGGGNSDRCMGTWGHVRWSCMHTMRWTCEGAMQSCLHK